MCFLSRTGSGEYCLTCSADKTVRLWNPHKGLGIKTYKGPGQEVLDAAAYVFNAYINLCVSLLLLFYLVPTTMAGLRAGAVTK